MPIPIKDELITQPGESPSEETATHNTAEPMEATDENVYGDTCLENSNGKIPFKKIFLKRKKSSERTRDKKLRQNRQLRKSMLPKNALMALNEVKGVIISDFFIDSNPDGGFTALVTVNSTQYEGKGISKMSAKNAACEKALRDYILARMKPRSRKQKTSSNEETAPVGAAGEDPMETNESDAEAHDDDLPMLNLASFALYKLFTEWEREGFSVPEMHPTASATNPAAASLPLPVPKEPKAPPIRTELPPGWETMHPATLLCIMRPGISYVSFGNSGDTPNVPQCLGVIVDNQEFTANGRSKKIARRNVAVNVCNSLFGTNFACED
ncbi:double-stranded RNA-specific editase 1-like isoform X2 [Drosophila takahashii]